MEVNELQYCGAMYRQFQTTGLYNYEIASQRIGTILVKPRQTICSLPLFTNEFSKSRKRYNLFRIEIFCFIQSFKHESTRFSSIRMGWN